jgi:hypothetical protein
MTASAAARTPARARQLAATRAAPPADGEGVVAFLTLGLDPGATLAEARRPRERGRKAAPPRSPGRADVIVYTEP